jgi:O-antigen/teichoic acid export membrane protein
LSKAKNTLWLTGCRLSGDIVNLLLFVLISRQFGPSGVGGYSYAFAVATFGFVIGCLGIEEYGMRQYARTDPSVRPTFLGELLGTQAMMLVAAVLALVLYTCLTSPSQATLTTLCALGFYQITASLVATLFIPAMVAQRMLWPALAELTARVIAAAFAAVCILVVRSTLPVALLGYPLAALVWLALAFTALRRYGAGTRFTLRSASAVRILKILWSFALLEIFAQLFSRVGVIALSLLVSDAAAGYYATGLRLIEVALMPLSFLGVASYPSLSQLYANNIAQFRHAALDLLWLMLLGGAAVAWGLYFVAPYVLVPILGERFAGAQPVVQFMSFFALVQAVEVGLGRVLLCADRQRVAAAFIAAGAVTSLVLNMLWVPRYETRGAICAGAAAYLLINILSLLALRQPLSGRALGRLALGFVLSVGLASLVATLLSWYGQSSLIQALASAAAYGGIAVVAFRLRHDRPQAALDLRRSAP